MNFKTLALLVTSVISIGMLIALVHLYGWIAGVLHMVGAIALAVGYHYREFDHW